MPCGYRAQECTYDFRPKVLTCSPEFSALGADEILVNMSDMKGSWFPRHHVSAKGVLVAGSHMISLLTNLNLFIFFFASCVYRVAT